MGLLTKKDAKVFRAWFLEMAKLRGIPVQYQYALVTSATIHSEFRSEMSDPIDMDIIFETNPKTNTLKRMGWVSVTPNDKPYVAMLPYDTPSLTTHSVISIPPSVEFPEIKTRKFQVTRISSLIEYPDCFTVTLAPIFDTVELDQDYSTSSYTYLNVSPGS